MRRIACALASAALFAAAAGPASAATDGQWVAVDSAGGSQALFTLNPITSDLGGGERTIYTAPAGTHLQASQWSPDGNRTWASDGTEIAFVRGGGIFIRRIDGSGEVPLPLDGTGVRDLAMSPDGESLALWVGDHIDLADALSGHRETVGPDAVGGAAWTPDAAGFAHSWSPDRARPDSRPGARE